MLVRKYYNLIGAVLTAALPFACLWIEWNRSPQTIIYVLCLSVPMVGFAALGVIGYWIEEFRICQLSALNLFVYLCFCLVSQPFPVLLSVLAVVLPLAMVAIMRFQFESFKTANYSVACIGAVVVFLYLVGGFPTSNMIASWDASFPLPALSFWLVVISSFLLFRLEENDRVFYVYLLISMVPVYLVMTRIPLLLERSWQFHLEASIAFSSVLIIHALGAFQYIWNEHYVDTVTGLPNRQAWKEYRKRFGRTSSMALIHVDSFGRVAEEFGEDQASHLIRYVSTQLSGISPGKVFRMAKDRIYIGFADKDEIQLAHVMEQIREAVCEKQFYLKGSQENSMEVPNRSIPITISVGVAGTSQSGKKQASADRMYLAAVGAMERARVQGANQVVTASFEPKFAWNQ